MDRTSKPVCYIVGIGPGGSPKWLTHAAEDAIKGSNIILAWDWSLKPVKDLVAGKTLFFQETRNYLQKEKDAAGRALVTGETVAVLRVGDPCVSSSLAQVLEVFKDFDVRIVPSAGAAQFAAARAQICLDESVLVSFHDGHEAEKKRKLKFLVDSFNIGRHLLALTNETQVPRQTASYLIEHGLPPETSVLVCEYMTMEDERVYYATLGEVSNTDYRLTSVMVIKNPGNVLNPCT
ncbi:precorrin-6y C5,15-methyltransferase (decarboxylating) subunit CbiE [Dehalogenimonas etheniformans]|uniref:Precorrin-6y C5,15-methyltransferase (Decarboxylating) subunit CbiE n=1 Tax=Dehalogenimonas etheniformans TaxID=1536648 RepID=A0A2P5P621_9CHLR|nr:precorrin-6y C5,15-methyltransferase (decarboxylating) subunit CbiE [Dehalogenimonas etheniformans]PPD57742.1 precorrin-6y C5,15-methyltransferase (decarboxylating) subunit CbiE [Dehalogenimonas etheniformans]QNT76084.1 precorrin-6y C5,15-methyltransferase (decarboxylating) subunit CbiE [Dehalogenimonas etheniformans]